MARRPAAEQSFFLPDFCAARMVFAIVLIAELVAIMLTLARYGSAAAFFSDLARTSLFLLWIALTSAALLCSARSMLARLSVATAAALSFGLLLLSTVLVSEVAWWLGRYWHGIDPSSFRDLFPERHGRFLAANLAISAIVSALILRYFYVAHEWKRNVQMEARSRIHALQARIRPHFLFNSMNTIAALTRTSPARAEEAVEDLADLFRATLKDAQAPIRLKEELEVARIYQRIEQLRLGERLQVEWDVASLPMRARVPSLIVQPLIENAIYHGIEPLPEGGTVIVAGGLRDGRIRISVSNPIPGDAAPSEREGNRLALANIRERLQLSYGARASLHADRVDGEYRVTLEFPHVEDVA
ncbi:MAG: sensor histidine kinase [Gammaproteobacteria bacterium]